MTAAKKIKTRKTTSESKFEFALERRDVLVDGSKVGEVYSYPTETCRQMASGVRYDVKPAVRWAYEGPRCFMQYRSAAAAAKALVERLAA